MKGSPELRSQDGKRGIKLSPLCHYHCPYEGLSGLIFKLIFSKAFSASKYSHRA